MAIKILSGFEGGKVPSGLSIVTGTPVVGLGRQEKQGQENNLHRWALVANKTKTYTNQFNSGNFATSNSTTSGSPTYSVSASADSANAYKAFNSDETGSEGWACNNTNYITLDLGANSADWKIFGAYQFVSGAAAGIVGWSYYVSSDNFSSSNILVDSRSYPTAAAAGSTTIGGATPVFTFTPVSIAYRYHRIQVNSTAGFIMASLRFFTKTEANNQAQVTGSLGAVQSQAFGSFCTYPGVIEFGNTNEQPIVEFGNTSITMTSSRPFAKGHGNITAASDVGAVLRTLKWFGASDLVTVTAAGNYAGATGSFNDMTLNIASGTVALKKGDYYVAKITGAGTDPAPQITITNVAAVTTTYTGTVVDSAFKTELGTGTLYKITLPEAGNISSSDTDPINIGASADVWIPYEFGMDPRESEYYKLEIDNGVDTPVSINTVRIRKGRWAMIRFNVDNSGANAANDCYVSVTDTEFTSTLNQARSVAGTSSGQVIIRGLMGDSSRLDDMRIDDSGTKGAPPEIIRAELNLPLLQFTTTFSNPVAVTDTSIPLPSPAAWLCAAPNGANWYIDHTATIRRLNKDTYASEFSLGLTPATSYYHSQICYHPGQDALFFLGTGIIGRIDYVNNTASVFSNSNITGVTTLEQATVTSNAKMTYVPRYNAIVAVTRDAFIMIYDERTCIRYPHNQTAMISTGNHMYAPLYDEASDTLLFIWGTGYIGKFKISAAIGGASSTLYATWESASASQTVKTINSLSRMGGLEDNRIFVSAQLGAANLQNLISKKVDSSDTEYIYSYATLSSTVVPVYHPFFKKPLQNYDYYHHKPMLQTALADSGTYQKETNSTSVGSNVFTPSINYLTGDLVRSVDLTSTAAVAVKKENIDATSVDVLRRIDSSEYYSDTLGQKILIENPTVTSRKAKLTLGRNVFLNSTRGGGTIRLKGLDNTTVSGPGSTPTDLTLKDYVTSSLSIVPELAWYGDSPRVGTVLNSSTSVPLNHGSNTSVVITSGGVGKGRVEETVAGGAATNPVSLTTPVSAVYYSCIKFDGAGHSANNFTKYASHAIANSTGDFCINMCLTVAGIGYMKPANTSCVLFTSDTESTISNANGLVLYGPNVAVTNNSTFELRFFGNTSTNVVLLPNYINYVSFGRSGGSIILTLNGVQLMSDNTSPNIANSVNWGPIGIGGSNNDSTFSPPYGGLLSWALYPNNYVVWPFQEGHAFYQAGNGILIQNG